MLQASRPSLSQDYVAHKLQSGWFASNLWYAGLSKQADDRVAQFATSLVDAGLKGHKGVAVEWDAQFQEYNYRVRADSSAKLTREVERT